MSTQQAHRSPAHPPRLSIIVPAFNEAKLIGGVLRCIRDSLAVCRYDDYELIVCDNASTDATAEIARAAGAQVVSEPHRQIARARNTGARRARGRWLLFVDADSWPSPRLMSDLLLTMQRSDVVGGGASLCSPGLRPGLRCILALWNFYSRLARFAAGSFLFCRADAFAAVGGFDQTLYATEELVLSSKLKAWARSRRLRFIILHRNPISTSSRKQNLYSAREHWALVLAMLRSPRRVIRDPARLKHWYDGRR